MELVALILALSELLESTYRLILSYVKNLLKIYQLKPH